MASDGFRMTVAGGLGPLPTEAKLLHEFIPAEDVVRRVEAVIRVFNRPRQSQGNKNKARLKFVLRERGFDWLRDAIEEQYQDILANGGIPMPENRSRKLRWFSAAFHHHTELANCCRCYDASFRRSTPGARPTSGRRNNPAMRSSRS